METSGPSRLTIARYLAGSHAYGLDTPASDIDERVIYVSKDLAHIFGFKNDEFEDRRNETQDLFSSEIRYFLELLRRSSTGSIECLFTSAFQYVDKSFTDLVIANKKSLIDSKKFLASTMGYIQGERRLANGERTGKLGSKRKLQLDEYGFSPKNYTNLFRLAWCAEQFLRTGEYPLNVKNTSAFDFLYSIKTEPKKFNKQELHDLSLQYEENLRVAMLDDSLPGYEYKFDNEKAVDILYQFYTPTINEYGKNN